MTVLGLYLVLRGLDFRALLDTLRTVRLSWMAVGAAAIALSLVVRAYRWHVVLRGVGSSIRFGRLVELLSLIHISSPRPATTAATVP